MRKFFFLTLAGLGASLLTSCQHNSSAVNYKAGSVDKAVAAIRPVGDEGPRGSAWFMHERKYLRISVKLEGLTPDKYHGIQIDTLGGCEGRGPEQIYDPQGHFHAGPAATIRRAGNLGNMKADADGKVEFQISLNNATLNGDDHPILGRSITVNEGTDDLRSDPHGGLGKVVACGTIGVAPLPVKEEKIWYTAIEKPREELVPESLIWYMPEDDTDTTTSEPDASKDDGTASE